MAFNRLRTGKHEIRTSRKPTDSEKIWIGAEPFCGMGLEVTHDGVDIIDGSRESVDRGVAVRNGNHDSAGLLGEGVAEVRIALREAAEKSTAVDVEVQRPESGARRCGLLLEYEDADGAVWCDGEPLNCKGG
jgi:hypothetical protein